MRWGGASGLKVQKSPKNTAPREGPLPGSASPSEVRASAGRASPPPLFFSCAWADPGPERPWSHRGTLFGGNNASARTWANTAPHRARRDLPGRGVIRYVGESTGSQALSSPSAQRNPLPAHNFEANPGLILQERAKEADFIDP